MLQELQPQFPVKRRRIDDYRSMRSIDTITDQMNVPANITLTGQALRSSQYFGHLSMHAFRVLLDFKHIHGRFAP